MTECWICRRDHEALLSTLSSNVIDVNSNTFCTYKIIGKAENFDAKLVEKEVERLKKLNNKKLDNFLTKLYGSWKKVPSYWQMDENPVLGKSYWYEFAEKSLGVKAIDIPADEGLVETYYKIENVEIALCRICDTLTTWKEDAHGSLYRETNIYSNKETEKQIEKQIA